MTGLNIDYNIGKITWGDLKKNHPIFYYFFALRSLNAEPNNNYIEYVHRFKFLNFRNIHGFNESIINNDYVLIDSQIFNEEWSCEGENFWKKFFDGIMTYDDKKQLYKLILNEANNG